MTQDLSLVLKIGIIVIGLVVAAAIVIGCASLGNRAANGNRTEAGNSALAHRGTYSSDLIAAEKRFTENPDDSAARIGYAAELYRFSAFHQAGEVLAPELRSENPAITALALAAKLAYLSGRFASAAEYARAVLKRDAAEFARAAPMSDAGSPPILRGETLAVLTHACYQTGDFSACPDIPRGTAFPAGWEEQVRGINAMMKAFGTETPNRVEWNGLKEATIPFLMTDPLPIVEVAINGRTIYALIDTGGASFILDTDIARSLGIKAFAKSNGVFAFGITSGIGYAKADSLEIGGVTIRSAPIRIKPTKLMSKPLTGGKYEIGGIIGTNVLQRFLSTMDYPGGRLILRPRASDRVPGSEVESSAATGVPFFLTDCHVMLVAGSLNGRGGLLFFMDSGLAHSESGFIAPIQTLGFLGLPVPQTTKIKGIGGSGKNAGQIGKFEIDRLTFGPVEKRGETGLYGIIPADWYEVFGFLMDGLVSHRILKDYAWTIDFDRMEMRFEILSTNERQSG
jgi:hypothetical protein